MMELLFIFVSGNAFSGKVTGCRPNYLLNKQRTLLGTEAVNGVT